MEISEAQADARPGRRDAIASLVLLAALPATYLVGYLLGSALGAALDLEEGQLLTEAGAPGVLGGIGLTVLLCAPQAVGAWLGLRARRLGEARLGTAGLVGNALVGGYLLATSAIGLVAGA